MLRSSREGRKQAARFHAFPSGHPPFPSRYSHKVGSSLHQSKNISPSQSHHTARTLHNTTHNASNKSSLLRQEAFDSESESESSSAIDDADDSTNGNSSHTSLVDAVLDETITQDVEREVEAKMDELGKRKVEEDAVLLSSAFHRRKTPSRETTEEQSQSLSQYNPSPLSSPPTSHPDEDDIIIVDNLKDWQERLDSSDASVDDYLQGEWSLGQDSVLKPLPEEEKSTIVESRRIYKRLAPRPTEVESMLDNRSQRIKVKSLKRKEADETLALSPTSSKRKYQAQKENASRSFHQKSVQGENLESQDSSSTSIDITIDSIILHESVNSAVKDRPSESVTSDIIVSGKRGRGRPLGSTKQKSVERRASEMLKSREASIASIMSAKVQEPNQELESFTDNLIRRRSARRSEAARVSTPEEKVVKKDDRPVRVRMSLPDPRTSKLAETPRQASGFTKTIDKTVKSTRFGERTKAAGPSADILLLEEAEAEAGAGAKPIKALWKRKSYLTSGLYSNDYKQDEPARRIHRKKSTHTIAESLARGTSRTRKAHRVSALPLPIDYGLRLLEQERDFRLPFPIAQEMQDIRDKLEAKKKPPPYKHISQNQYFSRAKLEGELMICHCPADGDCGESCVNRLTEYLCHPKHCPCGDRCTNNYFGKRKAVKTEVQWYGARGFGLKTLESIKKGSFIDEYRGEVVDFNEAVLRIRDHYKDTGNYYFLMYDAPAGEMLDGGLKGNITRFANHSCFPNCKVQKWLVCGTGEFLSDEYQVALFAERDIRAGEELTYDYGWSAFAAKAVSGESNSATPDACHCGAAKCSGFLGVKKSAAPLASEVVSKVLKRSHKKKVKSIAESLAGSSKSNTKGKASTLTSSKSMPISLSKSSYASSRKASSVSPTKAPFASPSPTKSTTAKSRRGLMEQVMDGLNSPVSALTSLSSLSDDDVSEMERSVDSTMGSYDSEPIQPDGRKATSYRSLQQRREEAVRAESSLGKRKRFSARGSSPFEVAGKIANGRGSQAYAKSTDLDSPLQDIDKDTTTPKTRRILLKDRVIRILVPNEKIKEAKPDLVIEGKRERKMSLKAVEFDSVPSEKYYNKRRESNEEDRLSLKHLKQRDK